MFVDAAMAIRLSLDIIIIDKGEGGKGHHPLMKDRRIYTVSIENLIIREMKLVRENMGGRHFRLDVLLTLIGSDIISCR